jgi:hypothetical protein
MARNLGSGQVGDGENLVFVFLPGGGGGGGPVSAVAAGDVDVALLADQAGEFVEVATSETSP